MRKYFKSPRNAPWFWETVIVMAALLVALSAARVWAVDKPESRKMSRQMDVMEQIFDQVLVDSPNFLVFGRKHTHGLYVKDFGMIFTFEASLVGKDGEIDIKNWGLDGFEVRTEDGKTIIIMPDERGGGSGSSDESSDEAGTEDEGRSWADRRQSRQERTYGRGKTEMIDVLLDYGDTITSLDDSQWVAVVAQLIESDYFEANKISHLILKAKISDLRAYAADKINEKEMITRIVEEEY
jgi:hypothetical protein